MNRLRPLGIVLFIVVFSTACSEKQKFSSDSEGDRIIGSILTYDTSLAVNEGRDVSLIFWTQVDYEDLYRTLVDDYMEIHPNVSIELVPASFKDHFSKLQVAMAAGIGPDIFHMHNSYTDSLLQHMSPYPESVLSLEQLIDEFSKVPQHIVNGNIYFIDTGFMTSSIFYNKRIWENAGLSERDFPETWEDLASLAQTLTRFGDNGEMEISGFNPNGQGFELFTAMNIQQGQPLFSRSDLKTPLIDTPESRKTLRFIKSLYEEKNIIHISFPLFHESFGAGGSAMIYSWGWTSNWLAKNFPQCDFGTFPTPVWRSDLTPALVDRNNRESSMAVSKYSSQVKKDTAFDFLKYFLASDKYLREINIQMGTIPSKKSLEKSFNESGEQVYQSFISIMNRTVWPGIYPASYEEDIINLLIDPIIIDNESIDQSLGTIQKIIEPKILKSHFVSME